jgi:hypothetical protein
MFLAYFPKTKAGLSNQDSVCLCVCLSGCPPLITLNSSVDFHEIWQREPEGNLCNKFQSHTFNHFKITEFKVVRRAMYNSGFGLFMNHDNHDNQTFSLLPKNESRLIKSPVLSVCEISVSQGGEYEV